RLSVGLSSDTSGHRCLFLMSPAEQASWAVVLLARVPHRRSDAQLVTPTMADLWRRAQPIIRHRLTHMLRQARAPCLRGSAFRAVARRYDDTCAFIGAR